MRKTYAHHTPTASAVEKIKRIRKAFDVLHDALDVEIPHPSREMACTLTNLETASMWAIKALVLNDPQSVVEA
jgi:hypothetical protein